LALSSDDETFLKLFEEKSRQIEALQHEATAVRADNELTVQLANLTTETLKAILLEQGPEKSLHTLVDRIVLEPDLMTCQIELKAVPGKGRWLDVASPRGFEPLLPP
jgi:hypothetical protein